MKIIDFCLFQKIIFELKNVQTDICDMGDHVQRMEDQMTSLLHMMEHMCRLLIGKEKHKTKTDTSAKLENRKGEKEHMPTLLFFVIFSIALSCYKPSLYRLPPLKSWTFLDR